MESPVARLALTNGFQRSDRNDSEERYVKKLSNGKEAWLRTRPHSEYMPEKPMDMRDAHSGRHWEFLLVSPAHKCGYCNNDRPATKSVCPHCKQSREVKTFSDYQQLASGSEMTMNYLLGALLQRLATWNPRVPKPTLEALPVPDPDDPSSYVSSQRKRAAIEAIIAQHPDAHVQWYTDPSDNLTTTSGLLVHDLLDAKLVSHWENVSLSKLNPRFQLFWQPGELDQLIESADPDDPEVNIERYITKTPYLPDYAALARIVVEHPEIYIQGQVKRTDHHYVHERSTDFTLEMLDMPPEVDTEETGELANRVEKLIGEEIVNINQKIYRALEREWDYLNSDEQIDDNVQMHDWTFSAEGEHDAGDLHFNQLNDEAKERAREWYRDSGLDYDWWVHVYDEWKAELKEMGFDNVDISFSGFSSQGDGASFTADRFDFLKWANWHMSNKPTERGHPYTDDLTEALDPETARISKRVNKIKTEREAAQAEVDDPVDTEAYIQREVERRSEPIKKLEIRGRRWFRRGGGGVYCKAYIYINDKLVHTTPEHYGYGDHYLTLATDWLRRNGYLEGLLDDERDPIWHLRDKHKIDLQYGVRDVPRERDL